MADYNTMVPLRKEQLSEAQYWRDFEIIRVDVDAALVSWHTLRTIRQTAAKEQDVLNSLNRDGGFWHITLFSLHTTVFIVLARILDVNGDVHSIHRLLEATLSDPAFFSKNSLRNRRLASQQGGDVPVWLDKFVEDAWEPTAKDLRAIEKGLRPHTTKFFKVYWPIRNQIAHTISKDPEEVTKLYANTLLSDIDELLRFLSALLQVIWEVAYNGRAPDWDRETQKHEKRVQEVRENTQRLLRSCTK